jgi:hypothetical protein
MEKSGKSNKLISQFIPSKVVKALAALLKTDNADKASKAAVTIASAFGSDPSFKAICEGSSDDESHLIASFQKNLTLLVQKTWVEKSDEDMKEQVLYKLEQFCKSLSRKTWASSYVPFLEILDGVVYLMFGAQTKSDDFEEYALRIDPEFGTFWWYVQSLPKTTDWSDDKCRVCIELGMFFLANY